MDHQFCCIVDYLRRLEAGKRSTFLTLKLLVIFLMFLLIPMLVINLKLSEGNFILLVMETRHLAIVFGMIRVGRL